MKTHTRILLIFSLFLFFLFGCKTQKSRDDISPISKFWHNMNAEYNGYFNADVLYMESMTQLEQQHQDNYNQILPVYKYRAADNPKSAAASLDKAIEKLSIVISLHRQSVWTDDCYLLIGKSQYLKQDFESAEETLEYMVAEFPVTAEGKTKKVKEKKSKKRKRKSRRGKKKRTYISKAERERRAAEARGEEVVQEEEEQEEGGMISIGGYKPTLEESKPSSYFLKHRPAYQEGLLWLARTYIERGELNEADRLLKQLESNPGTFKDVQREVAVAQAYFHIERKEYASAAVYLEKAISLESNRTTRARYAFILGQLYRRADNAVAAAERFEQAAKWSPGYAMAFRARLNLLTLEWSTGKRSATATESELDKMLKDIKNVEYKDQIYFTLAQINLLAGDKPKAIENLRLALNNSTEKNLPQKAEAYLTLGNLYFESEQYVNAKNYFDSTLSILPRTDDRYTPTKNIADNLTEIADNLSTIQLQDSLLNISRMTEDEKAALAFEIKKQREEAERQQLLAQANQATSPKRRQPTARFAGGGATPTAGAQASSFFAYDDRALKRGLRDFERKWGNRALEDNWRLNSTNEKDVFEEEELVEEVATSVLTEEDIEEILRDVPETEAEIEAAHQQIQEAMFNLGRLYRERLERNDKSIEILESLLERYPNTSYKLEAWYFLYLAHQDAGNRAEAQAILDKMKAEFPNSTIVKALMDPNYVKNTLDKEHRLNVFYSRVLADFNDRKYDKVIQDIRKSNSEFGKNHSHAARFALMEAMARGSQEGEEVYIRSLKELIAQFPDAPEATRAKEILRLLGALTASGPGGQEVKTEEGSAFKYDEGQTHYVIIAFDGDVDLNRAKIETSDYHREYHSLDKLRVTNIMLGDASQRIPIIVVRRFEDKAKAMDYYEGIQKNKGDFVQVNPNYKVYPVSQTNYREILKNKGLQGYDAFFQLYYLN